VCGDLLVESLRPHRLGELFVLPRRSMSCGLWVEFAYGVVLMVFDRFFVN
jgi:hypothetical protein